MIEFKRAIDKNGRPNGFYVVTSDGQPYQYYKLDRVSGIEDEVDFFNDFDYEKLIELKDGNERFLLWVDEKKIKKEV